MRVVAVFPLNVHTRTRGQIHFYGLGISGGHLFKYRMEECTPSPCGNARRRTQLVTAVTPCSVVLTQKPPA
jgi:hypothetical protein